MRVRYKENPKVWIQEQNQMKFKMMCKIGKFNQNRDKETIKEHHSKIRNIKILRKMSFLIYLRHQNNKNFNEI